MSAQPTHQPNPAIILDALRGYQVTFALKGAVDLDLFTHIGAGAATAAALAPLCQASERGLRILCDFLVVTGFLTKSGGEYALTPDTALFLDKKSPAYMGSVTGFLAHPAQVVRYQDIAAVVRKGGALDQGTLAPDDPIWVEFARNMAPMMALPATIMAQAVTTPGTPAKVLDIAAGHGIFGLMVAKHNPAAEIYAADWAPVLAVAQENAAKFGAADRYHLIPGSAFETDLGSGYDVVLLPNFVHHFDRATNVKLLKKLRAAMKPAGVLATVEFVPNEDRVSPPLSATFAMMMLGGTPAGDAYTFAELDSMFREAGFGESERQDLAPAPQTLILTKY